MFLTMRGLCHVGSSMRSHYGFGRSQIRPLSRLSFLRGGKTAINNTILILFLYYILHY